MCGLAVAATSCVGAAKAKVTKHNAVDGPQYPPDITNVSFQGCNCITAILDMTLS